MTASPSTADAILDSAQPLIIAGGYNGFSYADIADVVGIRKASIHHHFRAKADLVCALVSRYRAQAVGGLSYIESQVADPLEQLRGYLGYWAQCITDASAPFCVCAMLACELPILPNEVAQEVTSHFRALSAWVASVLARGLEQGVVDVKGSVETQAEAFMATVHGAMLSARAYGDPTIFHTITAGLVDGLTTKGRPT